MEFSLKKYITRDGLEIVRSNSRFDGSPIDEALKAAEEGDPRWTAEVIASYHDSFPGWQICNLMGIALANEGLGEKKYLERTRQINDKKTNGSDWERVESKLDTARALVGVKRINT